MSTRREEAVAFRPAACMALVGALFALALGPAGSPRAAEPALPAAPQVRTVSLGLDRLERMHPNGSYRVQVWRAERWEQAGELAYDQFYRTRTLALPTPAAGQALRVRLVERGGGAAHVDSVLLNGRPPEAAQGAPLAKLARRDFDVSDAFGRTIEVRFPASALRGGTAELALTARVEGHRISEVPFQYPPINTFRPMNEHSAFYHYTLGSHGGTLALDGELAGKALGTPFFAENLPVGTGHPQSTTYGWVMDDGRTLYVAMDVTGDNTRDGNKDYTKVYVKTPRGLQEFKVTEAERRWGVPGFTYTDKVPWQHKVYQFAIPLEALGEGLAAGSTLPLAFAAYGTQGPDDKAPVLAFDPNHNRYLLVYLDDYASYTIYGLLLNADGTAYNGAPPFAIAGPDATPRNLPAVAFDPVRERFLVAWQEGAAGSIDILGRMVDANGTLQPAFPISSAGFDQIAPSVAYDLLHQRFLVVWEDLRSDTAYDIFGQLVDGNGALVDPDLADQTDLTDPAVNFAISTATGSQQDAAVAFDPVTQRFLVVWTDDRGWPNTQIYGQLVGADGALFGPDVATNFVIGAFRSNLEFAPALANDPLNQRFLVVWADNRNGATGMDLYGRLVHADGTTPAPDFAVSTGPQDQTEPAVAYDPAGPGYLVTFSHGPIISPLLTIDPATGAVGFIGATGLTYAAGVAYDGTTLYTADYTYPATLYSLDPATGKPTSIGTMGFLANPDDLAWDPVGQTLYAIGGDNGDGGGPTLFSLDTATGGATYKGTLTTGFNSEGMAFDSAGTLYSINELGSNVDIPLGYLATIDTSTGQATVVNGAGPGTGLGVVVGMAFGAGDAVLYAFNGLVLFATDKTGSTATPLYDYTYRHVFTGLAFDAANAKLFAIAYSPNGSNIDGQRVAPDGTLTGTAAGANLPIAITTNFKSTPATATNPYCGNALVPYRLGTNPATIELAVVGACANRPWLAYPSAAILTQGVTAGAAAGDTFTFQVRYGSGSETAPTVKELWIDLNHDSSYSAGLLAPLGASPGGTGALFLAGLLGLAGLRLLRAPTGRRPAVAAAALTLAAGLTAAGIVACGGGGGGGSASSPGTPGITVSPTSGLQTTEAGGTATFTVVLATAPSADVSIALSSNNTAEGTVNPSSLTFTAATWNTAQTVTATGVQDNVVDGNQPYTIATAAAVSGDSHYSGLDAADVSLTNIELLVERIAMTEVDAGDDVFSDGKLYQASVIIAPAGSYTYTFVFSDGTSTAVGLPALPATLTVQ